MAEFEKKEFKFPDEVEQTPITSEAEPEFEIEIEDDTPEVDRGRTPVDPETVKSLVVEDDELDQYSKDAKEKLIKMKKIWHDERRAKEAADRERQAAVEAAKKLYEDNKRYKEMLSKGEKEYVEAMTSSTEMKLEMAKKAYKEAYDLGDVDRQLEAQQQMTQATMALEKARNFKLPPLQEESFDVQTSQEIPPPPQPDRKVMEWQQRNPWFGQDEEMTAAALGLHAKLKSNGVVIGSDDYYAKLDATMRKRFPENFDEDLDVEVQRKEDAPKAKPAPAVVAPATRTTSSKKVKLTTSQQTIAKKLGLTPEQYVRELLKMEA